MIIYKNARNKNILPVINFINKNIQVPGMANVFSSGYICINTLFFVFEITDIKKLKKYNKTYL